MQITFYIFLQHFATFAYFAILCNSFADLCIDKLFGPFCTPYLQFFQLFANLVIFATFHNFCNVLLLIIYNLNLIILNCGRQCASLLPQSLNLLQVVLVT